MTKILEVEEIDYATSEEGVHNSTYHGAFIVVPPEVNALGSIGYCSKDGKDFAVLNYTGVVFNEILEVLKGAVPPDETTRISGELVAQVDTLSQHNKSLALQKFSFTELQQLKAMELL